ncbi:MAG: HAD-IB family phosphatase [Flavobacterium sp.]
MRNIIALFDVCGTLYHSNTTYDFMKFFLKRNDPKRYYRYLLMKSWFLKPFWKLLIFLKGNNYLNRKIFLSLLKGYNVERVQQEAKYFVENQLNCKKMYELHEKLESHLSQNHHVVLLSASIEPVIQAIANHLGIPTFLSTQLGITNETYNGEIVFDMEGKKKASFEKNYQDKKDKLVYFYSDNKEDIDLLESVDKPTIICRENTKTQYWLPKIKNTNVEFILKL